MKKVLSLFLSLTLLCSISVTAFAANENGIFEGYREIVKSEITQSSMSQSRLATRSSAEKVIIHNNGKSISSDYFADGQSQGNYLIAVTSVPVGSDIIETAYFANEEAISENELVNIISNDENNIESASLQKSAVATANSTIRRYDWSFYDPSSGDLLSTLSTAVTLDRKSSNSTIDGVPCSVWDVTTFSELEKEGAARLNDQYTRLSVDLANEELISYGPSESTSGGDLTVGLDGAGVPSFSYSFNIDGFSVEDLSSMSNDYGRWAFIDNIGNESHFTTKPGIRATNTHGSFVAELSHTVNMNSFDSGIVDQGTGVLQIYVSDR